MSKEKQIEEMAKMFCGMKNDCDGCMWGKAHCHERSFAEEFYNAGYRKQIEWVSVEERLPDDDSFVLLCTNKGTIVRGRYQHKWKRWDGLNHRLNITHWMPLPEAPKMRKEDEGK